MRPLIFCCVIALAGCGKVAPVPVAPTTDDCSPGWMQRIDETVGSGDGMGHGPDIGSNEWQSVIEFRLGVRGEAAVPPRDSDAWCRYIDDIVTGTRASSAP